MSSIKDVAKLAKVSISTVSLAFNQPSRVSDERRGKIFEAAKQIGFTLNTRLKGDINNESIMFVATVFPNIYAPFYKGVQDASSAEGVRLLPLLVEDCSDSEIYAVLESAIRKRRITGMLFAGAFGSLENAARENGVPIVNSLIESSDSASTLVNNYKMGVDMAHHFVKRGFKSIAYIGDDEHTRMKGFIETLNKYGITPYDRGNWRRKVKKIDKCAEAYYEFITPFAEKLGYYDVRENGVWTYVFNDIDMTNWEMDNPIAAQTSKTYEGLIDSDFPVLYGWVIESNINNVATWVRNPYYFKVDADGQQLPYVDYLELSYAEDNNTKLIMQLAGGEDYVQEEADKYSILVESSEQGGYEVRVGSHHNIPTVAIVNINYGLDSDGTVKEDEDSRAWQEVINDIRFRQALVLAIDADEITDVYTGMAEPNPLYNCINDVEAANELLDEMGMADIDGDGYRETPSGLGLTWQIWTNTSNSVTLTVPFCELLVEYWREIGLRVTVNSTEASLMSTSINSNEAPMYVYLVHMDALWHHQDWQLNGIAPLWNAWVTAGGMYGADTESYLEPTQWYKELRLEVDSLMKVDQATAVNEVIPNIAKNIADNGYLIAPVKNCGRLMIVNKDLGNVPYGGLVYSWNMAYEQVFYRSFSYED